jgi:hypothetical protein
LPLISSASKSIIQTWDLSFKETIFLACIALQDIYSKRKIS